MEKEKIMKSLNHKNPVQDKESRSEWKETDIGRIPINWDVKSIDDIKSSEKKSIISGPFGSNISAKFFEPSGIPVIRGNNLSLSLSVKFFDDGFVYVSEEKANELNTWAKKDDLIFTAVGTIGQVGILTGNEKYEKYIISNKQLRVSVNKGMVLPLYAYYWFASPNMVSVIESLNTGSSVPLINLGVLKSLQIPLPSLPEQTAIAEVLSSLDDKIDLLHRQNKTLEQLAEALFRQWFVEEADESWEVGTIDDVVSMKGGTTPSTTESKFWDGKIHWTSPRDLSNTTSIYLFDTSRKITEEGLRQISSGLLPVGTLLLSSRAPIGYLALTEIPVAINQGYIAIICDKIVSNYFMFLWCKANMDTIENAGNGSVFQEISKSAFRTLEFLIPPKEKLKHFDRDIEPIFLKIKSNTQQICTLTQLRDTLLPKLMSGEVRFHLNGKMA